MKRFATALVIALIAVASVFGASQSLSSTQAEVSVQVTNDKVAIQKFGFTFNNNENFIATSNDMSDLPADVDRDIQLTYKNGSAKSEPFYIYYKVKGATPVKLQLGTYGPLKNASNKKTIDFNLNIGKTDEVQTIQSNVATKAWEKEIKLSSVHIYDAALIPVELVTTTPIDAGYISDAAYSTKIELRISAE